MTLTEARNAVRLDHSYGCDWFAQPARLEDCSCGAWAGLLAFEVAVSEAVRQVDREKNRILFGYPYDRVSHEPKPDDQYVTSSEADQNVRRAVEALKKLNAERPTT